MIIDKNEIGTSASGRAGGFLAKDWTNNISLLRLYEESFKLHQSLAVELQLESYRPINTLEVTPNASPANKTSNVPPLNWLHPKLNYSILDKQTAQVSPMELLQRLLEESLEMGAELLIDTVDGIEYEVTTGSDHHKEVQGVYTRSHGLISSNKILIALGPWTGNSLFQSLLLPLIMEHIV